MNDASYGLNARLDNWGAAMGGRMLQLATATESLEGQYRAPRFSAALGAPVTAIPPDREDAEEIESAVVLTPLFYHALLRAWYVRRLAEPTCVRRAREVGGPDSPQGNYFEKHLIQAHAFVAWALELPAIIRKDRARAYVKRKLAGDDPVAMLDSA